MNETAKVFLDGELVPADIISPKHHTFVGMFRWPYEHYKICHDVACPCGHILRYREESFAHYLQGHWDIPQYKVLENIATTCTDNKELAAYVERLQAVLTRCYPAAVHQRAAIAAVLEETPAQALREVQREPMGDIKSKYFELLYAVATKFPGETRHETALRYIQQAENKANDLAEQGHNIIGNAYPELHDEGCD